MLGNHDVKDSLIYAVRQGRLEKARELINTYGLSYSLAWSNGYFLLWDAIKNRHPAVAKLLLTSGCKVNSKSLKFTNTPLHFAALNGDLEIVEMILDKGGRIDAKNKDGKTPLHNAIEYKKIEVTELLLKRGADVNAIDNDGINLLHVATREGCLQIVEHLIKYGAYVNCVCTAKWKKCYGPLHLAVERGSKEVITLLLSSGANVDIKGEDSITPLHIAAKKGYLQIAEDLLSHGACTHSFTLREGYTPLHFASELGNEEAVKLFLNKGADVNASTNGNLTPLHIATKTGHKAVVKMLLQHGAKVDNQDKDGKTTLYLAVENGYLAIVEDILKHCPDINDQSNLSSLKIAVQGYREDYKKIVEALLEYGFFVNPEDANNPKLLHAAVEKENLKIIEDLLKYGADVNTSNSAFRDGFTPLHSAAKNKQEEVAKLLIRYKADINAHDKTGKTPIFYAIENADLKITKLLLTNRANIKDSPDLLVIAVNKECIEIVEALLQHDADINASALCTSTWEKGYAPLHFAVEKGSKEVVTLLLSRGANVDVKEEDRRTPLHIAAKKGFIHIAEDLLNHGACTHSFTLREGYTPLHFAFELGNEEAVKSYLNLTPFLIATKTRRQTVVELLLQHGAKVDNQDKNGKTTLHLAVEMGYLTIVEDVLKYCPDIKNQSNRSSIKIAVHGHGEEYTKIVEALLEYGLIVNPEDANNPKLLHAAVEKGYLKIVEDLLKYGADVNTLSNPTFKSFIPLHIAAKNKREEVAKLLIRYGADINAQDETGRTPIFFAINNSDLKISKLLLTNRANIKDNPYLLIDAVENQCIEIVEALLQHGADINASTNVGITALHCTAFNKGDGLFKLHTYEDPDIKGEIAKLLLSKGANVDAQTRDGVTTLLVAIQNGYAKVVEALLKYNANVNSIKCDIIPLHSSAQRGHAEISTMLLNKGANVNAKHKDGFTALHIATQWGRTEVVKVLLKWGADVDSKIEGDLTPLHLGVKNCFQEIIENILKFGANIDNRDKYGRTELHIASDKGYVDGVVTLLEYGADINITTRNNDTPLNLAMDGMERNQLRNYSSHQWEATVEALKRHIVKMKTANLYYECEKEIASMKNEKIDNPNISFYDILAKCTSSLATYMRNENIVRVLKSDDYKTKFPIYARMVESHFRKGMERKDLLDQVNEITHFVFNNFPELPYVCTEKIFSYLSDQDLRILMDIFKLPGIRNPNTNINDVLITSSTVRLS